MNLFETSLLYWVIYFISSFILLSSLLFWVYYNLKNKNHNFKLSKRLYITISILLCFIHISILIFLSFLKIASMSILCSLVCLCYNLILAKYKPTSNINKIFYVFFISIVMLEISINLIMIDLFCRYNTEENIYFIKFYHAFLFSSQLGPLVSIFNSFYYLLHIYFNKEKTYFILLTMITVHNIEDTCSICIDDLKTKKCVKTSCNHIYHEDCIKVSLEASLKCPMCRNEFQYTYCF
jgi:hypothetical protein